MIIPPKNIINAVTACPQKLNSKSPDAVFAVPVVEIASMGHAFTHSPQVVHFSSSILAIKFDVTTLFVYPKVLPVISRHCSN